MRGSRLIVLLAFVLGCSGPAKRPDGGTTTFKVTARLDTPVDVLYFKNGGILQTVLRKLKAG